MPFLHGPEALGSLTWPVHVTTNIHTGLYPFRVFSVFYISLSYFSDVQDESSLLVQRQFTTVPNTRTEGIKGVFPPFTLWPLPSLCHHSELSSCPQVLQSHSLWDLVSSHLEPGSSVDPWIFTGLEGTQVAILHHQEKHKHTFTPTLAQAKPFSCHDIFPHSTLGFTSLSCGGQCQLYSEVIYLKIFNVNKALFRQSVELPF